MRTGRAVRRADADAPRSAAALRGTMQPAVARTGGGCFLSAANGAPLPPPSQASRTRAERVLAAPAAPVRSLSESLVGTGLMLVRWRAVVTPHSALTQLSRTAAACPPCRPPRNAQLHPEQGLVAVYGVVTPRDDMEARTQGAALRARPQEAGPIALYSAAAPRGRRAACVPRGR